MFYRIIGLLFILLPFLPAALLFEKGQIKGAEGSFGPYQWLLGIIIVFFVGYFLSLSPLDRLADKLNQKLKSYLENDSKRFLFSCLAIAFIFLNISAYSCFRYRPHLIDSIVQFFQAKIYAAGMLKAATLKHPEFFVTQHMIFDSTGWYSQYPPGHQLLLSIGILLGAPWLINVLLTVASIALAYKISKIIHDNKQANLSLLLATFCPFLLFMGSDYMNHVPTLTCILLFTYFYFKWEENKKASNLFYASLAIGFAFLIRPLTALGMAIPFGFAALFFAYKNKLTLHLLPAAIGSAIFIFLNCAYNKVMYGDPFVAGYIKLWGKSHDIGFHVSPWGEAHTPLTGLRNELADLFLLNEYQYEWPIPFFLLIGVYLFFNKQLKSREKLLICSFLMLPGTYFFYWHRDAYLGPRFMYEGCIFLVILTSSSLIKILEWLNDKKVGKEGILKPSSAKSVFAWCIILSVTYELTIGLPTRFTIYSSSFKSLKFDITERAKEESIDRALIFMKVTWGVRLMSEIRALGVSASLTQDAYSHADHCRLQELLDQAKSNNWSSEQLSTKIHEQLSKHEKITRFYTHVDNTLKLASADKLTEHCKDELAYDTNSPFIVYSPQVTANDPRFDGDYIVAMDMRNDNKLLLEQYPDYPAYLYLPDRFVKLR